MADAQTQRLQQIAGALAAFSQQPMPLAAAGLLNSLGYSSDKTIDLGNQPADFVARLRQFSQTPSAFDDARADVAHWQSANFLFQLTNDEIPSLMLGQSSFSTAASVHPQQLESFVFLAVALKGEDWSRTALARITRELNRAFPMPAIMVFSHGARISIAVIDRRAHKRDAARDVMTDRISIIKDIRIHQPHAAHLRILAALAADTLSESAKRPSNFRELYDAWLNALSVQELNKKFYTELAHWYFWARTQVQFPPAAPTDDEGYQSIAVIRLLTRLIFVWFIKEKGLVPERLFDAQALGSFLKESPLDADGCGYYQAILQNLFFATLNVELGDDEQGRARRRWADNRVVSEHYLVPNIYRFAEQFKEPDRALDDLFGGVPFLNGGLFECLDRELTEADLKRDTTLRPYATEEKSRSKTHLVLRADGFSRRPDSQARVPNRIFFGSTQADLSGALGDTKRSRDVEVKGLLDIFANYKFTVDENTPVEEEVALDPELLGKVFENLLASYNKDTKTTARKQSGSFYTPRVVVDYMVDEALVVAFSNALTAAMPKPVVEHRKPLVNGVLDLGPGGGDLDLDASATLVDDDGDAQAAPRDGGTASRLRHLLGYREDAHRFAAPEVETLIDAIERLKVLDPACGSGAYPMGVLAKLVHVLRKLDPDNRLWRARNRAPLAAQLGAAKCTPDPASRAQRVDDAEATLRKFDTTFDANQADYTRKLFLIEKCIHGVDIQPIAVQIAKLRFFIALIVEQKKREGLDNFGLTSLPNLETKIVAANTLFGVPRQNAQGSLLNDPAIAEKERELREANTGYFTARTRATKKRRREEVQKLHEELVALLKRDASVTATDADRMARWDPFDQNHHADFFDVEWMFGMPRAGDNSEAVFDVVIGNPPYVRHEDIKDLTPLLKTVYQYECGSSRADLYVFFYERSVKLLKPDGVLSFITSNKWYRAKYGEALRLFMATHTRIDSIIDFGDEKVFDAIAYPTIVIAVRRERPINPPPDADALLMLNWNPEHKVEDFPALFAAESFDVPQKELRKNGWQLEPPLKRRLLTRIRTAGLPLGEYTNGRFYRGIITGLNSAFVIDGKTRDKLILEDPNSAELIRRYLRGRDIKRWQVEWADLHLIAFPFGFHTELERYPAILRHLEGFETALRKRGQCTTSRNKSGEGQHHWLELDNNPKPSFLAEFEQPKLIVPAIATTPSFAPDLNGHFSNNKSTIFLCPRWEFSLGVLNSSVNAWLATQVCASKQNGFFDFEPRYSSQLVVPKADSLQTLIAEAAVAGVLISRDARFEQLINGLVYELFFPEDLHAANIHLFDACERESITRLAALQGTALQTEAEAFAARIFSNSHPIYAMLFDLQTLDVVRLIEERD